MKTFLRMTLLVLAAAFLQRAPAAPFTDYLDEASNAVVSAYSTLTNTPPPLSREQLRARAALGRALRDLQRPSTTVAGDFNIFFLMATHLLPLNRLSDQEPFGGIGLGMTNAFQAFIVNATIESIVVGNRIAEITPFQRLRRAASNQVAHAQRALAVAQTTDNILIAMIQVRLAYAKLTAAAKLEQRAAARQGFAPDSVAGRALHHTERSESGTVQFIDEENYTDEESGGSYDYERTGLNTGRLTFQEGEGWVTTVNLTFTSATAGRFNFRSAGPGGSESGSGTFTLE